MSYCFTYPNLVGGLARFPLALDAESLLESIDGTSVGL